MGSANGDATSEPAERPDGAGPSAMVGRSAREESRLLRWDAALRRAAAEEERTVAARQRAEAARQRAEIAHEQAREAQSRAAVARKRIETLDEGLDRFVASVVDTVPGLQVSEHRRAAAALRRVADRAREADQRERAADAREAEADERDRLADERDAEADERDRLADERDAEAEADAEAQADAEAEAEAEAQADAEADERDRPVDGCEVQADERHRRADDVETPLRPGRGRPRTPTIPDRPVPARGGDHRHGDLVGAGTRLRAQSAALCEALADEAEVTAATFDSSVEGDGRAWRASVAATERRIAEILRRNADRMRRPRVAGDRLEPLPSLPPREPPPDDPAESDQRRG